MSNLLTIISKTCSYDHHGYYMLGDDGVWSFFPFEKGLSEDNLLDIANTLRILNER